MAYPAITRVYKEYLSGITDIDYFPTRSTFKLKLFEKVFFTFRCRINFTTSTNGSVTNWLRIGGIVDGPLRGNKNFNSG